MRDRPGPAESINRIHSLEPGADWIVEIADAGSHPGHQVAADVLAGRVAVEIDELIGIFFEVVEFPAVA